MNHYIKIIKYIFINIILKTHELENFFINKFFLYKADVLMRIIFDRDSFFINDY